MNDATLRRLVAAGSPVSLSDGEGLTFTLSAAGAAAWTLRYRFGGRRRELTLGRYSDMSLPAARKAAAKARVRVDAGEDVAAEKQRRKMADALAWTVRDLLRDYETRVVPGLAPSTAFGRLNYLRTDLLPALGSRVARDVTPDDAQAIIERAAERSYWAGANIHKAGAALFQHARARRIVTTNPFHLVHMTSVAVAPATRQRIALNAAQMRMFLLGLPALAPVDAALAELLLRTGVRIGEALGTTWQEIDTQAAEWRIPRERIKTRKRMAAPAFVIRLHPSTAALFERLRPLACGSPLVFPALAGAQDRNMDHERALDRLKAYVATLGDDFPSIVFHDLRSTVRSGMRALGIPAEVCERALNHQLPGLVGVYDVVQPERVAAAFVQWSDYLDGLRKGAEVIPIKRGA
ncbi:MAG: tyrosine-type recombinase/integrase [Metallibacterium scheffleri]|nr:tyrosine-type recombinase/integrase [Metallibacterium scheffleri]